MSARAFLRVQGPGAGALPVFNRDAAALARAARARGAYQARLVDTFRAHLEGRGAEPSDADLRTFALLVAAEHQLEQKAAGGVPACLDSDDISLHATPGALS